MTNQERLNQLSSNAARSTIAVVDALAQRGAFRGEELMTIGQLREQCVQIAKLVEDIQHETISEEQKS